MVSDGGRPRPPRFRIGGGALETEGLLLDDLDRLLAAAGDDLLRRPVLIVVPSRSLRAHLLARIVRHRKRAVAGVSCLTLYALAAQICERTARARRLAADPLALLARRLARSEPSLTASLSHLSDGYSRALGAVRDLVDAGYRPAHREALLESLAAGGREVASREAVERAGGVVRVAAAALAAMEEMGLERVSTLLQAATEALRLDDRVAPPGALLVHGFADATGVAAELIHTLLQSWDGCLYLDRPPDPAAPGRTDPGVVFTRRFVERLGAAPPAPSTQPLVARPRITLFRAAGAQAEAREAARRIRSLLDGGARPEGIALVARRLEPYRTALRTHLWRLGIPFSAFAAAGPRSAAGRRLQAALDLASAQRAATVERWLDALEEPPGGVFLSDLRTALFALGAGRVSEVAELEFEPFLRQGSYPLPVRLGFSPGAPLADLGAGDDLDPRPSSVARRRRLDGEALAAARGVAADLVAHFESWRSAGTLAHHVACFGRLLVEHLGWDPREALTRSALAALERAVEGLPGDLQLELDELVPWLGEALGPLTAEGLGGAGGGIQVLDVVEARGRTFEHLFLLGLNRGVFPRNVKEDPLLPDSLRGLLSGEGHGVLGDLRRKMEGIHEERFLFAQLLSASPEVTLSWQETDDDGSARSPSPLVERLRWSEGADAAWKKPPLATLHGAGGEGTVPAVDRPACELALDAALNGRRRDLVPYLALALEHATPQAVSWSGTEDTESRREAIFQEAAAARVEMLREIDPYPADPFGRGRLLRLGPWFGVVGPVRESLDPRRGERLHLTTLESMATCPWRTFVERSLRIAAPPDPLGSLPELDPLLMGQLVHGVLERLSPALPDRGAVELDALRRHPPREISWPDDAALSALARERAGEVLREAGIGLPGFAELLAEVVEGHLEWARTLEWGAGGAPVVAVEAETELAADTPGGARRALHFRADRVDRRGESLWMTDYKTGRGAPSTAARADTRRKHLLQAIRSGEWLQAAAYALAGGRSGDRGRYVFLHPDFRGIDEGRILELEAEDGEVETAFRQAVHTLLEARDLGLFLPRLVEPDRDQEPAACARCAVAEACVRGDSGLRARLRNWMEREKRRDPRRPSGSGTEAAALALWLLPSKKTGAQREDGR